MLKIIFSLLILIGLCDISDFCPSSDNRSEDEVLALITLIETQTFESAKLQALREGINTTKTGYPKVFDGESIVKLLKSVIFDSSLREALSIIDPYILRLNVLELISIVFISSFSDTQITTLSVLADTLQKIDNGTIEAIVGKFTFSSDKQKARDILELVKGRNCVFGTITEKSCIFIIDVSGSMEEKFLIDEVTYTRLSFVQYELTKTIVEQLKPYQNFNIFTFSGEVKTLWNQNMNATEDNIKNAVDFVKGLTVRWTGTDIYSPIEKAFSVDSLRGIYFLTDGIPNVGETDRKKICDNITELNEKRTVKDRVVIHSTSFLLGKFSPEEKTKSRELMKGIASVTHGSYRGF